MGELLKKSQYQFNVFAVILYFASEMGKRRIPGIKEAIFYEFRNAIIEYLTGEAVSESFDQFPGFDHWQIRSNKIIENAFENFGGKINIEIKEVLLGILTLNFQSDHGEKWFDCSLYFWFSHSISKPPNSTFSLSVEFVERVKSKTIPMLDAKTIKHCEAIGVLMRKYLEEDVKYIQEHYHW